MKAGSTRGGRRPGQTGAVSMIGRNGSWFAGRLPDPARLSFRSPRFESLDAWRAEAIAKVEELLAAPATRLVGKPSVDASYKLDGLEIEELSWRLPYGGETAAFFIKPAGQVGKLPGVLALHDHGANKLFGKEKIVLGREPPHPLMVEYQGLYYGGRPWANELARRGYAVLVHDVFPFGSRRISRGEVPVEIRDLGTGLIVGGPESRDTEPATFEEAITYNRWAAEHEAIVAKSLFSAGTTWPGLVLAEDRVALDYLVSRPEVDPDRIGAGGLSGGGLRTVYLAGTDPRIKAAFCSGFMTTWRDLLLHKSFTHTWMAYTPLLPGYLDFPELLALRVPLPTLVQNCTEDSLFTLAEVRRAFKLITEVYRKAKATERCRCALHPGGHQFSLPMQEEAFAFLDTWLKAR